MNTRSPIYAMVVLLLVLLASASAFAQDDTERAQQLYKEGAEAYYTDDYSGAIMKFKSGYALDPNPMFLYNIAVSYGRLGNIDEAYGNALQAQRDGLPKEAADKNSARLNSWGIALEAAEIAEEVAGPAEGVADACTTDAECPEAQTCDTDRSVCVATGSVSATSTSSESGGLGALGWTGIALGVAGVGLVTTSLILNAGLSSDFDALDQARAEGNTEEERRLEEDIESTQSTGQILLFAGAGAAIVGTTLLVIDLASGDDGSTARLAPIIGPGQAGAAFTSRF